VGRCFGLVFGVLVGLARSSGAGTFGIAFAPTGANAGFHAVCDRDEGCVLNTLLPLMLVPLLVWIAVWGYLWNLDGKVKRLEHLMSQSLDEREENEPI
jgi:hypothetical protein